MDGYNLSFGKLGSDKKWRMAGCVADLKNLCINSNILHVMFIFNKQKPALHEHHEAVSWDGMLAVLIHNFVQITV